jgi:hypothetical protein
VRKAWTNKSALISTFAPFNVCWCQKSAAQRISVVSESPEQFWQCAFALCFLSKSKSLLLTRFQAVCLAKEKLLLLLRFVLLRAIVPSSYTL